MNASFCIDTNLWKEGKADSSGVFYKAAGGFYLSITADSGFISPAKEIQLLVDSMAKAPSTNGPVTTTDQPPLTANDIKWNAWIVERPQDGNVEHTIAYFFSNYSGYVLVKIFNYTDPASLPLLIEPIMRDFKLE